MLHLFAKFVLAPIFIFAVALYAMTQNIGTAKEGAGNLAGIMAVGAGATLGVLPDSIALFNSARTSESPVVPRTSTPPASTQRGTANPAR